ncbi:MULTISPECIES: hypothetical protein [unclassified Paraburkholderia]|uniref:hypothetical protein n=1 Tax=unclassified Paraburkholderia TaxID=2615204 RepID=UPI001612B195|nr:MULTISPECIES: hypothetical protein [unclassified Paraburkholderia]MBB5447388.1 hypothetical protein [Paraburkholderia sp. WSM4177]MBB5484069.1 hypothetical protein [Paraburkholderia sp. WSM4180]
MKHHIVGRYRGFVIEAHLEPRAARFSDGIALTYRVTWSLRRRTRKQHVTGDLADAATYESESVALTCVDRKARALIDAMLANQEALKTVGL